MMKTFKQMQFLYIVAAKKKGYDVDRRKAQ